jgi:hypothetical protein
MRIFFQIVRYVSNKERWRERCRGWDKSVVIISDYDSFHLARDKPRVWRGLEGELTLDRSIGAQSHAS